MKVIRAAEMGMCFGVRNALHLAGLWAGRGPLTILGELVHNAAVNAGLREMGVELVRELDEVRTRTVMITAHGTSDRTRAGIRARGHLLVEATCPLVRAAHMAVLGLARSGYHPLILGRRGHVEVRGLTGDLETFDVIGGEADVERLAARPRFGMVAQTTLPAAEARRLAALVRLRFPGSEARFVDTVCRATKLRQEAAAALARRCDAVVIAGDANSNNTRELARTCACLCPRIFRVRSAKDLRRSWFEDAEAVGLTAGASVPDSIVDDMEKRLLSFARAWSVGA